MMAQKPFLSTRKFLLLIAFVMLVAVVFLWKNHESQDLSNLQMQTEATAIFMASDVEARYRGIYNSLLRFGNEGAPEIFTSSVSWERDASLLIDSIASLNKIYWVDTLYMVKKMVSTEESPDLGNISVNELHFGPTEIQQWVPLYKGTYLQGFILAIIDVIELVGPSVDHMQSNYRVRIENNNELVFSTGDWSTTGQVAIAQKPIILQGASRLTLSCSPTASYISYFKNNSRTILLFSLLFAFLLCLAIYFAQNHYLLSTLSESRFRQFLEEAQLVAIIIDIKGTIIFCNDFFLTLSGYERDDVLGRNWFESFLLPGWDHISELYGLHISAEPNPVAHAEYPILISSGDSRWLLANNSILRDTKGTITGTAIIGEDITFNKQADADMKRRLQNIQALFTIDQAITGQHDLSYTLSIVLEQVVNRLDVDAAAVLVFNNQTKMLEYAAGLGFKGNAIEKTSLRLGEGGAGQAVVEKKLVTLHGLDPDSKTLLGTGLLVGEGIECYHAVPLLVKDEVKGVLELFHRKHQDIDEEWLDFFLTLAQQTAIAIENATLFADLQKSNVELINAYDTTIEGWSHALDMRDKETENHTQRVTEMTVRLTKAAGMTDEEIVHVRRGALLHDIGKMGVPDHILFKTEKLTDEDWKYIRRHPTNAFELLSPIAYLQPAMDIPYCHHEKWDGSGYPRGLKGEQIPLSARLFAVVDVWDALLLDRPYRAGWPADKVYAHIRSLSGTHFDPEAVELFFTVLQSLKR
jgi:PAS domain S-box-containing protein